MNPSVPKSGDPKSELDAPPRPELRWLRWCLVLFLFSFALDFRPPGTAFTAEGPLTYALFGIALLSGGLAFLIGLRHLLVRPVAFLILLWFGFLALKATLGILQNHDTDQIIRSLIAPLLLGLGITTTHVAACSGMRAPEAVRWFLTAVGVSLVWKFGAGFLAQRLGVFEVNLELLNPVIGLLVAWSACALLLKPSISRWHLAFCGAAAGAILLGILGGMTFPVLFPAAAAGACLFLGFKWRFIPRGQLWIRLAPAGVFVALGITQFAVTNLGSEFGLTAFRNDPATSIPNLLGSGGIFSIALVAITLLITLAITLRAAWRNSETVMGRWAPDVHLMFLPFVAMFCLLGESLVRNPLSEPFAIILFGFLAALPQFFFNRAHYLRHRENEAAITPQLILSEEDLPTTWEGAFPQNA